MKEETLRRLLTPAMLLAAVSCGNSGADGPGTLPAFLPSSGARGAVDALALDRARDALFARSWDDVGLLSTTTREYPVSGQSVHRYVFQSRTTGHVSFVDLDPTGKPLSDDDAREGERLALLARFGHMKPALAQRIEGLPGDTRRWVVLYLPVEDRYGAAGSSLMRDPWVIEAEQARVRAEVERGLARLVDALGAIEVQAAEDGSPWVSAHLTVAQVRALARTDLVGAIFDGEEPAPQPQQAQIFQNAEHYALSLVDVAHNTWGALGSGIRVADVNEPVSPHPNLPFNPYGSSRTQRPLQSPCNETCNTHGSFVMGYIQNTNPADQERPVLTTTGGNKGVAPLAMLFNASPTEFVGTLIHAGLFTASSVANGTHTWTAVPASRFDGTYTGFLQLPNVWQVLPDNGTGYGASEYGSGPRLDYTMDFPITGTYYVWIRGKCVAASCGNSDSVHVGVDSQPPGTSADIGGAQSSYNWKSRTYPGGTRPTINITTAGPHTINVWMREDGFTFDAMVLTPLSDFTPVNNPNDPRLAVSRDVGTDADQYAWLASKTVRVANNSMGGSCSATGCAQQTLMDQLADYYATRPPYILSVSAAGNNTSSGTYGANVDHFIYNGLVVGAAQPKCYTPPVCDPRNSTDRTLDHTVHNFRHANPRIGTDWELPHMVAYGAGLHSSITNGGESSGTSYATPQVAGTAALVLGENPDLTGKPEGLKAILMAGADVNTDLNSPGLGAAYSYLPRYNALGFTGAGVDRHGGAGLLNAAASVEIAQPSRRLAVDNRMGLAQAYAIGGLTAGVAAYQASVTPTQAPIAIDLLSGTHGGFDVGFMDPTTDFDGIYWKHYYYFRPTVSGKLRIAIAWNRPFSCTGTPVTCGATSHPLLIAFLKDLDFPSSDVANAVEWEPNDNFMVANVTAGKTYRLGFYKQNSWSSAVSYAFGAYLTANPQ